MSSNISLDNGGQGLQERKNFVNFSIKKLAYLKYDKLVYLIIHLFYLDKLFKNLA